MQEINHPEVETEAYALAPDVDVFERDGALFVIGAGRQWMTRAPVLRAIAHRLSTGPAPLSELAASGGLAETLYAIETLRRAGVVRPAEAVPPGPRTGPPAAATLASGTVLWAAEGTADGGAAHALAAALVAAGHAPPRWHAAEAPPEARALLVPTSDPLGLTDGARIAREARWAPVVLDGSRAWLGPWVSARGEAGATCWACLSARLAANRPVERFLAAAGRPFGRPFAGVGPAGHAAARHLAARLVDVGPDALALPGGPREIAPDGTVRDHPAPGRPDCPFCQARPVFAAEGVPDTPTRRAGGLRSLPAETVAARLAPLVSDLTGLVADLYPVVPPPPEGPPGRHVVAAPFLRTPPAGDRAPEPDAFHGIALGKGRSAPQARASALCEAVERISAIWRDGLPARRATRAELGSHALAPDMLWQFSAEQTRRRDAINAATADPRRHVPPPLDPHTPIWWTRTRSLTREGTFWVPREHDRADAPPPRHGRYNPNGCAAGATPEEAAIQGFLELVERDAVAIWWYNRIARPALDLGSALPDDLQSVVAGIEAQGWRVWALDLTTDLGLPVATALARAEADGRWCIGFGAHLEMPLAAERAVTELVQLFRADGRDGPPPWTAPPGSPEAHLFPVGAAAPAPGPVPMEGSGADILAALVAHAYAQGLEVFATDLTHPEIGMPVVKVTVPGLRHFWPRFAPGRLYDVPVRMGWRTAPLAEAALNPVPLFV